MAMMTKHHHNIGKKNNLYIITTNMCCIEKKIKKKIWCQPKLKKKAFILPHVWIFSFSFHFLVNFQDNKNSDDVSFLKAILLLFSSHWVDFYKMHQNKQTFMFVFTLILNMLPGREYKMPCHFSMRKICQFLSIQHKSLMSASASEVFTFSPNTTPSVPHLS